MCYGMKGEVTSTVTNYWLAGMQPMPSHWSVQNQLKQRALSLDPLLAFYKLIKWPAREG